MSKRQISGIEWRRVQGRLIRCSSVDSPPPRKIRKLTAKQRAEQNKADKQRESITNKIHLRSKSLTMGISRVEDHRDDTAKGPDEKEVESKPQETSNPGTKRNNNGIQSKDVINEIIAPRKYAQDITQPIQEEPKAVNKNLRTRPSSSRQNSEKNHTPSNKGRVTRSSKK